MTQRAPMTRHFVLRWMLNLLALVTLPVGTLAAADLSPWPELSTSAGRAQKGANTVHVVLDEVPASRKLVLPRLYNRLQTAYWRNDPQKATLRVHPEPEEWIVHLTVAPPAGSPPTVVIELDSPPLAASSQATVVQTNAAQVELPGARAATYGKLLRYEPQPHKDTIGYWANASDWASWRLLLQHAGAYDVEILQGCGRDQGGSEVDLLFRHQDDNKEAHVVSFAVEGTGHFQNFRKRRVGRVHLDKTGVYSVEVRAKHKAKVAVMDLRWIRLVTHRPAKVVRPRRPHVLVLFTDDQGTLDASCYGSRDLFTPSIDGLANDGVRFTQAYAHTVCCPARAMLMTGRHPQRSGVNTWMQSEMNAALGRKSNMALSEVTLAEVLRDNGYRTALFGKWHLGAASTHGPTKQGFDQFFGLRNGFIDNYNHYYLHRKGFHDLFEGTKEVWREGEYFPDLMTARATKFIDEHVERGIADPFFLYVGFNIPHYPEQADTKFDQHYVTKPEPRRSYGRVLSTTDDRIGRILAKLDEHGLRDDTVVVFMSDNGHSAEDYHIREENHNSGYATGHNYGANGGGGNTGKWRGHKGTFYEGGIRVPAIIRFPRQLPQGLVRDQAITAMDWYPTLLELCGITAPDGVSLDGHSLLPVIHNNAPTAYKVMHWQWQNRWCVRDGDWKLIHDGNTNQLVTLAGEEPERKNHANDQPALVERLTKLHQQWTAEVN